MSSEFLEQQTGEHQQNVVARAQEWLRDTPERDDRGMLLFTAKRLFRHPVRYGALFSGVAAAVLTAGVSIESDADLNAADTEVNVNKIVWDPEMAITPATVYFDLELSAEDITYNIVVKPCTPIGCSPDIYVDKLDPRVNKILNGAGQETIKIPFDAISQTVSSETGKTDMLVDMSKLEGQISWAGAGPQMLNFTISDGERNFNDQSGFRDSYAQLQGSIQKLVNIDTFANTYKSLDTRVEHDMKQKALEMFAKCNEDKQFVLQLQTLADSAIRGTVKALSGEHEVGTIEFTQSTAGFQIDTGERAKELLGGTYEESKYLLGEDFKVDKLSCNVDRQQVAE